MNLQMDHLCVVMMASLLPKCLLGIGERSKVVCVLVKALKGGKEGLDQPFLPLDKPCNG